MYDTILSNGWIDLSSLKSIWILKRPLIQNLNFGALKLIKGVHEEREEKKVICAKIGKGGASIVYVLWESKLINFNS